ncbi:MAG: septum formation protein Maf [Caldisericales bacterium]|nr:septum formation protein Maf [Caldisericales bacterium]
MTQENHIEARIILASGSPRRTELLKLLGVPFIVINADVEEKNFSNAEFTVRHNSQKKALAVFASHPDKIVIACDTAVCTGERVYGKPSNSEQAREFLRELSGKTHSVLSCVTLIGPNLPPTSKTQESRVTFKNFGEDTIESYIRDVNTLDKAGAYGIQERGWLIISEIDGPLDNVMGLPLSCVVELMSLASDRGLM